MWVNGFTEKARFALSHVSKHSLTEWLGPALNPWRGSSASGHAGTREPPRGRNHASEAQSE